MAGLAAAILSNTFKYETQEFMRKVQQRHPGDFWINYFLGCFWWEEFPQEAVGYLRVAVAIRPTSEGAYHMLGRALSGVGDTEGAIAALRRSIALNPIYTSYGYGSDVAARELAWLLASKGELEEARAAWEKFLERQPQDHGLWHGYAELCLFFGKEAEYRQTRAVILDRLATERNANTGDRAGRACLLLPASAEDLARAEALIQRALAIEEKNAYFLFARGLADYRLGRLDSALAVMTGPAAGTMGPAPRLIEAMALHQLGRKDEARKYLQKPYEQPKVNAMDSH